MEVNDRYIKISPEVISGDIFQQTYDGKTFGLYSSMTMVLSAGTNGSSLLTGLTIPIVLEQSVHNIGYYDVFDGDVLQKDTVSNFIFKSTIANPNVVSVYNTSDNTTKKYLELSTYQSIVSLIPFSKSTNCLKPRDWIFSELIEYLKSCPGLSTI